METKLRPLSTEQLEVIAYIEEYWHRNSRFPPVGQIEKNYPEFDLVNSLTHETFRLALHNRGIKAPSVGDAVGLTPEQVAAIVTVINIEDKRPRHVKLKELGITPARWAGWLKQVEFKEFLHDMSQTQFDDVLHIAHEGLLKAVDRGDTNAVKLYMELTGRHTPVTETQQNLKLILARVVESIQRHVKDPVLLQAIANDFELIMRGERISEPKRLEELL